MALVEMLRRARAAADLSLAAVAARSGIAASNLSAIEHGRREPSAATVDRLAAALGVTLIPARLEGRSPAATIGWQAAAADAACDDPLAYRLIVQLADDLASAPPLMRVLLTAEPAPLTHTGWDAFLAAVVEWRLAAAGLPAPDWALAVVGDPSRPWQPPGSTLPARPDRVPEPFARRGVLVEADELASA